MDLKTQYCLDDRSSKYGLWTQCNPNQNPRIFFSKTEKLILKLSKFKTQEQRNGT